MRSKRLLHLIDLIAIVVCETLFFFSSNVMTTVCFFVDHSDVYCEEQDWEESANGSGKRKRQRKRKCKNRLAQLQEMYPELTFQVAAHYGPADNPVYVIDITIDGQVKTVIDVCE